MSFIYSLINANSCFNYCSIIIGRVSHKFFQEFISKETAVVSCSVVYLRKHVAGNMVINV